MTLLTETRHAGGFLVSEAPGDRSREAVTFAEGEVVGAGQVLGRLTVGDAESAAKSGGNTGTGTLVLDATTPLLAGAIPGVYQLRFVTATVFNINDPNGGSIGSFAIGGSNGNSVTVANHLKFALTQASTVFVIGDGFDITVEAGSGEYGALDLADLAGLAEAAAIAFDDYDATDAVVAGAGVVRDAEVRLADLVWPAGITADQKNAALNQLAARGILAR